MRTVAVLASPDVIVFDLATPIEVFGRVRLADGTPGYEVVVCGPRRTVGGGPVGLSVPRGLNAIDDADIVVVPGSNDPDARLEPRVRDALRRAHDRGARIASICVGALLLADTGLLDGRRATTHWSAAELMSARYPAVVVDPSVLYIDHGDVLTSAGATSGVDLCLHVVETDYGAAVAAAAARTAVMPLTREGGQAQYIPRATPRYDSISLGSVLDWLDGELARTISVDEIARRAALSRRTLHRRFQEQTGVSPLQWLHRRRIHRAQELLETTGHTIEAIAHAVGFASATRLRAAFQRATNTTPTAYRRDFRLNAIDDGRA